MNQPFLSTGFTAQSPCFSRFDTSDGVFVTFKGKTYKWSFPDFMKARDSIIEKRQLLPSKEREHAVSLTALETAPVDRAQ